MEKIGIIIVNYKSRDYLKGCVNSIFNNFNNVEPEIIIVNNDKEILENIFEGSVKIIEVNKNMGFGASCNIGAKEAKEDVLFFLNPDTKILSRNINDVLRMFDNKIGAVGAKVLEESGEIQNWSAGKNINIIEILKNNLGLSENKRILESEEAKEVDWVTGAAMFIRKDLFLSLGGFDENFFLYFEDIDLCRRVKEVGKKVIYFPSFQISHLGGKSSSDKREQKRQYYKSQDYYFEKWFGKITRDLIRFMRFFHF